jgi:hypothetical protein
MVPKVGVEPEKRLGDISIWVVPGGSLKRPVVRKGELHS